MFLYVSRPQNPGINFFKGPYRFAGQILGNSTTPPTSPFAVSVPFPIVTGQKLFARLNVSRADGRLATDTRSTTLVVA